VLCAVCPAAARFEFYCSGKSALSKVARGLITGFLPSLLIILWQVRPHQQAAEAVARATTAAAGTIGKAAATAAVVGKPMWTVL
jgi:hypothetical protein